MGLGTKSKKIKKQDKDDMIKGTNRNLRDMLEQIKKKKDTSVGNSDLMIERSITEFKALTLLNGQ